MPPLPLRPTRSSVLRLPLQLTKAPRSSRPYRLIFAGATDLNATNSAAVTGQVAQAGIGLVSATSDPAKNDTTFVGDLSQGVFTVTGSAAAGYTVTYAINGSTYQGALSAAEVTNGGTLVLDNGTGSVAFSISAAATSTAASTTFQTALTNQFAGATAHAVHVVSKVLESNGSGGTVPGSAITATSTAGTLLDGFDGSKVKLTSSLFDPNGTNLPPISNFTVTGTGTSTVFSVNVGGTTYSTQGTITANATSTLVGSTFDGSTGILNFYKNGDKTNNPSEDLRLDLTGHSGLGEDQYDLQPYQHRQCTERSVRWRRWRYRHRGPKLPARCDNGG